MSDNKRIHLIAICGVAMASLAGMLKAKGYIVTGSDENVYPPMSTFLEQLGIPIFIGYSENNLVPEPDLVVIGNVVSRGNPEAEYALNKKIHYVSLPEIMKEFFIRGKQSIVITGTHGKTTTTSLIAWILEEAGLDPSFFVGGIINGPNTSFKLGEGNHFVIEGDEYDTAFFDKGPKFMHYLPDVLVLNSVEYDHADIYPDFESVKVAFQRLINIIPSNGLLVCSKDCPTSYELSKKAFCKVETFGFDTDADWRAEDLEILPEQTEFDLIMDKLKLGRFSTGLAGEFNIQNSLAAIATCSWLGVPFEAIQRALRSFRGVKKRLEIVGIVNNITVYDDFAHHPTAIRETLNAVRTQYPKERIWALFEPRSATSRRKVFEEEFSQCFDAADRVVISGLYRPERIDPEVRLSIGAVIEKLRQRGKDAMSLPDADSIVERISNELLPGDKVVIMSNGGFGGIHKKLLEKLRKVFRA